MCVTFGMWMEETTSRGSNVPKVEELLTVVNMNRYCLTLR